jgi:hypothetical protein
MTAGGNGGRAVTIEGADRLARTTHLAARRMAGGYPTAEAAIGRRLADLARGRAPRRTGALASTIAADGAAAAVSISYGPAQEFGVGPRPGRRGGHNIRARRFMRGAAAAGRGFAVEAIGTATHRAVSIIRGA